MYGGDDDDGDACDEGVVCTCVGLDNSNYGPEIDCSPYKSRINCGRVKIIFYLIHLIYPIYLMYLVNRICHLALIISTP